MKDRPRKGAWEVSPCSNASTFASGEWAKWETRAEVGEAQAKSWQREWAACRREVRVLLIDEISVSSAMMRRDAWLGGRQSGRLLALLVVMFDSALRSKLQITQYDIIRCSDSPAVPALMRCFPGPWRLKHELALASPVVMHLGCC